MVPFQKKGLKVDLLQSF